MRRVLAITMAVCAIASPAWADWAPGDPYKMHYPQVPDPNGWDVNGSGMVSLADDFLCTETGPIADIHWWGSWHRNEVGTVQFIASIYSNDTSGTFNKPGMLLWQTAMQPTMVEQPQSTQSWYDPSTRMGVASDHERWFQYNLANIPDPFIQQEGQCYWLRITAAAANGQWGWKTSDSPPFGGVAVWAPVGQMNPTYQRLYIAQAPVDLAFVITPEPVTLALLALGGLMLLRRRH